MVKGIRRFLWLCMGMAAMLFAGGCSDKAVSVVKKGHFSGYPDVTIGAICKLRFNSGKWSSENESGRTCVYFRGKISKATREMLVERSIKSYSDMVNSAFSRYWDLVRSGAIPNYYPLEAISSEDLRKRPEWKTVKEAEARFLAKEKELENTIRLKNELSNSIYYDLPDDAQKEYDNIRAKMQEYDFSRYDRHRQMALLQSGVDVRKDWNEWRKKLDEFTQKYAEFEHKRNEKVKQLEAKVESLNNELIRLNNPKAFEALKQYLLGPQFWQVGSEVVFKWTVFPNGKTYRLDAYQNSTLGYYSFSHFMDIICKQ